MYSLLGCPRIGRNKKKSQNPSARILSHSLGSCELPKQNSAWSDMVYPSPKASAFYQIYKGFSKFIKENISMSNFYSFHIR